MQDQDHYKHFAEHAENMLHLAGVRHVGKNRQDIDGQQGNDDVAEEFLNNGPEVLRQVIHAGGGESCHSQPQKERKNEGRGNRHHRRQRKRQRFHPVGVHRHPIRFNK